MSRRPSERWAAALAASGLLAAAFLLPPRRPLPFDACLLHRVTGLPCLTCGLTRSICLFARGQWAASAALHPAGGLAFVVLVAACPWLLGEAAANRDLAPRLRRRLLGTALSLGAALSLLTWVGRLAGIGPAL